jgi:hypothetical protein
MALRYKKSYSGDYDTIPVGDLQYDHIYEDCYGNLLSKRPSVLCFENMRVLYKDPSTKISGVINLISQADASGKPSSNHHINELMSKSLNPEVLIPEIIACDEAVTVYNNTMMELGKMAYIGDAEIDKISGSGLETIQVYLSDVLTDFNLSTRRHSAKNYIGDPRRFNPILDPASIRRTTKISNSVLHCFGVLGPSKDRYWATILDQSSRIVNDNEVFLQFRTLVPTEKGSEDIVRIIDVSFKKFDIKPLEWYSDISDIVLPPDLIRYSDSELKKDQIIPP